MIKVRIFLSIFVSSLLLTAPGAWAQKKGSLLKDLGYPELQVTPLASQRLANEAKTERRRRFSNHIPLFASSGLTLMAALAVDKDDNLSPDDKDEFDNGVTMATFVGGGWLIAGIVAAMNYKPYSEGWSRVRKMPARTKREKLERERAAEEALYAPARRAWIFQWFPFVSNVGAALMLQDSNLSDDTSFYATLAALGSLAPVLMPYRWQEVRRQHREYKKRIYGPVASTGIVAARNNKLVPGMQLTWSF